MEPHRSNESQRATRAATCEDYACRIQTELLGAYIHEPEYCGDSILYGT